MIDSIVTTHASFQLPLANVAKFWMTGQKTLRNMFGMSAAAHRRMPRRRSGPEPRSLRGRQGSGSALRRMSRRIAVGPGTSHDRHRFPV